MKSLLANLLKTNQSNLETTFDILVSNNTNMKKSKQDTLQKFTDFLSEENTRNLTKYYYSLKESSILDKGIRIFRQLAAKNTLLQKILKNQQNLSYICLMILKNNSALTTTKQSQANAFSLLANSSRNKP